MYELPSGIKKIYFQMQTIQTFFFAVLFKMNTLCFGDNCKRSLINAGTDGEYSHLSEARKIWREKKEMTICTFLTPQSKTKIVSGHRYSFYIYLIRIILFNGLIL